MVKLGFRGGWTPPRFEFSTGFRVKAEKAIGKPFTERAFRDLEQVCKSFILARRKAAAAADFGDTRSVLTEWASHFKALDGSLEPEDINTMAAWMELARQSDDLRGINLPGRGRLQADIQAMAVLTQRAIADLNKRYSDARGGGRDDDIRAWIKAIAKVVKRVGGSSGSIWQTKGRRLDKGFCKLIELLRSELPGEVHLMSQEAVLKIAREALRSSE